MHRTSVILIALLLALLLFATACAAAPSGSSALPEGFASLGTTEEDDLTVMRFGGPGDVQDAVDGFATQLETEGWRRLSDTYKYEIAGYTGGIGFERLEQFLLLQSAMVTGEVRITLVMGPSEDMQQTEDTTKPTVDPDAPPVADIDGRDLEDAPRYPGSIRTKLVLSPGFEQIVYLTDATLDDVAVFHEKSLENNGWGQMQTVQQEKTILVQGTKDEVTLLIEASESREYPGYTEIRFARYFAPA